MNQSQYFSPVCLNKVILDRSGYGSIQVIDIETEEQLIGWEKAVEAMGCDYFFMCYWPAQQKDFKYHFEEYGKTLNLPTLHRIKTYLNERGVTW